MNPLLQEALGSIIRWALTFVSVLTTVALVLSVSGRN